MKVQLLVDRDGCKAGDVVDYGERSARTVIAAGDAVAWVEPPPEKTPAKPKARKPEPPEAPNEKES